MSESVRYLAQVAQVTSVAVGDVAGVANIVGVSGSIGIMDGESMGNLADGVGLSLTLAIEMASIATIVATVSDGTIARHTAIAIVYSGDNSISISMSHLSDGVGVRISLTLAVEMASIATIAVGDVVGEANIVGVSGGIGVMDGESMGNLADGVGLSLSLSLTLAIETIDSTVVDGGNTMDTRVDTGVDSWDSSHSGVDSGDNMVNSSHGGVDSRDNSPDSRDSSHGGMVDSGDHMVDSSHGGVDSGDHRVGGHNSGMVAIDSVVEVGVSLSISLSLTLAVVDSMDSMVVDRGSRHLGVATNSGVDSRDGRVDGGDSRDSSHGSMVDSRDHMVNSSHGGVDSRDHSPHSGVDSGDHRVGGDNSSMVANNSGMVAVDSSAVDSVVEVGISLSISLSLTLAISVDSMDSTVDSTIDSMDTAVDTGSIGTSIGGVVDHRDSVPVTNGTHTRDRAMAIVHSSDDTAMGEPMVDLSDGVGIGISLSIG